MEQAKAELEKLQKKAPKLSGTPAEMKQALSEYNAKIADAQRKLDAWTAINAVWQQRRADEQKRIREENDRKQAEASAKAVAELEEQKKQEENSVQSEGIEQSQEAEQSEELKQTETAQTATAQRSNQASEEEVEQPSDAKGEKAEQTEPIVPTGTYLYTNNNGTTACVLATSVVNGERIYTLGFAPDKGAAEARFFLGEMDIPEAELKGNLESGQYKITAGRTRKETEADALRLSRLLIPIAKNSNTVSEFISEAEKYVEKNQEESLAALYNGIKDEDSPMTEKEVIEYAQILQPKQNTEDNEEITPEQSSLLKRPNFAQYPTEQELSGNKDSELSQKSKEDAGENAESKASEKERSGMPSAQPIQGNEQKAIEGIAGKLGLKVRWVDSMDANGMYEQTSRTIFIARDAENPLAAVFGHEATHAVKAINGNAYQRLRDAVRRTMTEEQWDNAVAHKKELYESRGYTGYPISYYEEEVVCDEIGKIIDDPSFAQDLLSKLDNYSIIARIGDILKKITEEIKHFFGATSDIHHKISVLQDAVTKSMREAAVSVNDKVLTEDGIEAGYIDSTANYRASLKTYNDWVDNHGQKHEGTRERTLRYLKERGVSKKQIDKFAGTMDYWYDLNKKIADLVDSEGNFKFEEFHEWSEQTPRYKEMEGKIVRAISTLVSNGEYPVNIELSTDCIKREAFTQILDEMLKIDGNFFEKMTPAKIQDMQTLQKAYGIQVACPLCFVEGKRLGIIEWAKKIVAKWDEALEIATGTKDHPDFGFGKGAFTLPESMELSKLAKEQREAVYKRIEETADILKSGEGILAEDYVALKKADKRIANKLKQIEKKWLKKHPSLDGFKLYASDVNDLKNIADNNGRTAIQRMVRAIEMYPDELSKRLRIEDLIGSTGLMAMREMDGEAYEKLFSLIRSANGTGTPKIVQTAQAYDGEIIELSENAIDKASHVGGVRIFSFSDFDLTKIFDIMQIMFDLSARDAKVQAYTKEVPFILMFGTSGIKINMSMLPEARPADKELAEIARKVPKSDAGKTALHTIQENVGLDMSEDGKILGLQLSDSHSIPEEFAKEIFKNPQYNNNCGAIMVGIGVNHALYAMSKPYIRMVIPFHLSGMPIEARKKNDCVFYRDFTSTQNTRCWKKGKLVKLMQSDGKTSNHPTVKEDFNFYEGENEEGWNMRTRCREYIQWCEENGLVPKFDWAINAEHYKQWCKDNGYTPNQEIVEMMENDTTDGVYNQYYKVITDFTAYQPVFDGDGNMVGEVSAPHNAVTSNFNTNESVLASVLGVDAEGNFVDDTSMLANREKSIANANQHKVNIALQSVNLLNGKVNVNEAVDAVGGSQFNNKSDSDKFFEAVAPRMSLREHTVGNKASEVSKTDALLRDAVVDVMRESGIKVITDSKAAQRVLDRENGRVKTMSFGEKYDYKQYPNGRIEPNLSNKEVRIEKADLDHGFSNFDEAKEWAKNNIVRTLDNDKSGGKGNVRISGTAVGKYLSESAVEKSDSKDVHLAVLKVLPDVIRESVDVETTPDFEKDENGVRKPGNKINKNVLIHRCYGAV